MKLRRRGHKVAEQVCKNNWQLRGMVLYYLQGLLIPDLLSNGFAACLTLLLVKGEGNAVFCCPVIFSADLVS